MLLNSFTIMLFLLFFSSFLHQSTLSFIEPFSLSFPSFDAHSCSSGGELSCSGVAAISDGCIDLTPTPKTSNANEKSSLVNGVGRVVHKQPMIAWPANFMTTFTVIISRDPNWTKFGDGVAFFMAQDGGPSLTNSHGGFLGLFNASTQGKTNNQLAVELDTYMNEFDPNANHVGLNTKSIVSDATGNLDTIDVDLKLGRQVTIKIEYNGWRKNLEIFVAYYGNPLKSVLNRSIIMSDTVPRSVYVGFTGSTGPSGSFESHRIINWVFVTYPLPNYSLSESAGGDNTKRILIIAFPIVTGALVVVIFLLPFIQKSKWLKKEKKLSVEDIESRSRIAANAPKMFTFRELSKATNKFSKENLLGIGGFGSVYRGNISDPSHTIAVKRISATSRQGEREYLAEICTIGRLRHKNLVQLQGWCHEHDSLLLVYDFMPNGSLDRFISKGFLDWPTRRKILTGLASAILYLHEDCAPCGSVVIHRDIKPNNIMLDANYNARLGDFGLARLLQNETPVTTVLAGTPGYLAPECSYTGKATIESDVFSFGIVVLEVVCGRRVVGCMGENNLVDHVWEQHGKGQLIDGADPRLEGSFNKEEMMRVLVVGLLCSHPDPSMRPSMRRVVQVFTNPNEPLMELPASRPTAIYVVSPSISIIPTAASITTISSSFSCASLDETAIQFGR